MAPFSTATQVERVSENKLDGTAIYQGTADDAWVVLSIPNGGYILGIILEACIMHQANTSHKDPIHISAHFLRTTSVGSLQVHVRAVKKGRSFINLEAQLIQNNKIRISAHVIFGTLKSSESETPLASIPQNSPYHRLHPLSCAPSDLYPESMTHRLSFHKFNQLLLAKDKAIFARNRVPQFDRNTGFQSGAWIEFANIEDHISPASLALFADMYWSITALMPDELVNYKGSKWFPTMMMTIQFLAPLPAQAAPRTVGIYSRASFIENPQGQTQQYAEMWSAPSAIGQGEKREDWSQGQVCLAVSTQMTLLLPAEINHKLGCAKL